MCICINVYIYIQKIFFFCFLSFFLFCKMMNYKLCKIPKIFVFCFFAFFSALFSSHFSSAKILNFQSVEYGAHMLRNAAKKMSSNPCSSKLKKMGKNTRLKMMMNTHTNNECVTGSGMPGSRILCTGLGVLNGVGVGVRDFWRNLIEGKNVIDKVKSFDTTGMNCQIACEIAPGDFDASEWYADKKQVTRNDRYTNFAMAACRMALEDAKLDGSKLDPERFGVLVGSGIGGIGWMEKECVTMMQKGHKRVSPFLIPALIANTASGAIAIELNAQGPNHSVVSACASGGHAIGVGLQYMRAGIADVMLCGGAEASITPLSFAGFNSLRAMCTGFNEDPKRGSRPFDADRAGFVMGEGAGVMLLETEEHALRRGASRVYCEVAGYGATCDAHHITAPKPNGEGLAKCLQLALKNAGVNKEDVGYINAHGTSTPYNDKIETAAFKTVFGEELARRIPISSTKSMTGHCLGAAGGIEACIAAHALYTGEIPPTINYEKPDPLCDLNYTPNKSIKATHPIKAALSDTLGFGGQNAALVVKRYTTD